MPANDRSLSDRFFLPFSLLMIRRIELRNFMSHTHTVIEPAKGLTVLVGPNNCGKSAVVAALQILAHNDNSTYVLRHGEKECLVRVETDEGTVEWRRRQAPAYVINDERFDRLGRGAVPPQLHDVLRMPLVSPDGTQTFDIHFGEQKSPIFLIDKPASHAAGFFASSSDAIHLVEMQGRHRQKVRDRRQRQAGLRTEVARLDQTLSGLAAVPDLQRRLEELELEYAALLAADRQRQKLEQQLADLELAHLRFTRLEREACVLDRLTPPPVLHEIAALHCCCEALDRSHRQQAWHATVAGSLRPLAQPPALEPAAELRRTCDSLHTALRRTARADRVAGALGSLAAPPPLQATERLQTLLGQLPREARHAHRWQRSYEALAPLRETPLQAATAPLIQLMDRLVEQERLWHREVQAQAVLAPLAPPPAQEASEHLGHDIEEQQEADRRLKIAGRRLATFASLQPPPPLTIGDALAAFLQQLEQWHRQQAAAKKAQTQAAQALSEVLQALRQRARSSPPCPACGAPLDLERLVSRFTSGLPPQIREAETHEGECHA